MLKEDSKLSFYLLLFSIIFLILIFFISKNENLTYIDVKQNKTNYILAYNVEFIKWENYNKIKYYIYSQKIYTPTFESYFILRNTNLIFYEKKEDIKGYINEALIYRNLFYGKGKDISISYNYSNFFSPYFKIKNKNIYLYDCKINSTFNSSKNKINIKSSIPLVIIYTQ